MSSIEVKKVILHLNLLQNWKIQCANKLKISYKHFQLHSMQCLKDTHCISECFETGLTLVQILLETVSPVSQGQTVCQSCQKRTETRGKMFMKETSFQVRDGPVKRTETSSFQQYLHCFQQCKYYWK